MSSPEQQHFEQRSSVKIVRNAKGEPQWEIRVRIGDTEAEVQEAQRVALAVYRDLKQELL